MAKPYRLTFVHPCIGRRPGQTYLKTWEMEPLPVAMLAALTPKDIAIRFYDDRIEGIPYDEPTDVVAISVEVYTAKRAYQIASEYRKRGVPVVMGGFHTTLVPEEVGRYADSIVLGEAEDIWTQVLDDYRHGTPKKTYRAQGRPSLHRSTPYRGIFRGKSYLPMRLVEAGRGCPFKCDFCSIQTFYDSTYNRRPVDSVIEELTTLQAQNKPIFFVDDNIIANRKGAIELLEALIPLKLRWFSQGSINMANDEYMLDLMRRSGCMGVLIGFESMNPANLRQMGKDVNMVQGNYARAMSTLRRFGIRIYGTFVFGYDHDTAETFDQSVDFAMEHGMYLCGFNHLTPVPGTALYQRLEREQRLLYGKWWLDDAYSYNKVPFRPASLSAEEVRQHCLRARHRFYSVPNMMRRATYPTNRNDFFMLRNFFGINLLHLHEIDKRDDFPLGDPNFRGPLLEVG